MGRRQGRECHDSVRTTSVLNGDKVVVPIQPGFDLDTFPGFVGCYFFLCKVADDLGNEVNRVFEGWECAKSEFQDKLKAKSREVTWRQQFKPSPGRSASLTSSHLGGGDSDNCSIRGEMGWQADSSCQ